VRLPRRAFRSLRDGRRVDTLTDAFAARSQTPRQASAFVVFRCTRSEGSQWPRRLARLWWWVMADVQNISLSATCAERAADLIDGIEAATVAAGQARESDGIAPFISPGMANRNLMRRNYRAMLCLLPGQKLRKRKSLVLASTFSRIAESGRIRAMSIAPIIVEKIAKKARSLSAVRWPGMNGNIRLL